MGYICPMKNVALVLSGVVAGLVAGGVLVPWVHAEGPKPPPARHKWQQYCEPAASIAEASTLSTQRGNEGWELVGFFGGALCFKRPAPEVHRPAPAHPPADASTTVDEYGI